MSEQDERFMIAEFADPGALTAAARRARGDGFRPVDALTPCPVEGLDETLGLETSSIRWPTLIAGIGVAALAYGLEFLERDLRLSHQLRREAAQQLADLPARAVRGRRARRGSCRIVAFLILCGLPRLDHPLFDWDRIERATDDRYFLLMAAPEDERAATRLRALLLDAKALRIEAGSA